MNEQEMQIAFCVSSVFYKRDKLTVQIDRPMHCIVHIYICSTKNNPYKIVKDVKKLEKTLTLITISFSYALN